MPKIPLQAKEMRCRTLIDAAWLSVAHGGYQTLTVDDVCTEAGLSKGAFYTYFSHK